MTTVPLKGVTQVLALLLVLTCSVDHARAQPDDVDDVTCEADETCELGSICQDGACVAVCVDRELRSVYFDFDDASIRASEQASMDANALCLRAWRESRVRIEGHWSIWDSVGDDGEPVESTSAYALGGAERRARAVKRFLEHLGVGLERMETISYGIERPICPHEDGSCQHQNRRADLVWIHGASED